MTDLYHPRRTDRTLSDPDDVRRIMKDGKYATFALCDGDEPYLVTLSYGWEAERNRLYFHVAHVGHKLDIVRANPKACGTVVLTDSYEAGECEHPYRSVVMRGAMRIVTDPTEKAHALRVLVDHLEDEPDTFWKVSGLDDPERLSGFSALCFEIEHMVAKAGK